MEITYKQIKHEINNIGKRERQTYVPASVKVIEVTAQEATLFAFSSCQKESLENNYSENSVRVITATFENNGTKTTLGADDKTPLWRSGDVIRVFGTRTEGNQYDDITLSTDTLHLISTVALSTFEPTIFATAEDMTQNNMTKIINIDDWMISGGGEAGVSYFHKTDPSLILKMDNRETTKAEVEESLETARIVYSLGIPTPEPGEVVKHLHSTKGSGTGLRNIKETYGSMIMSNTYRPKELLGKAVNLLNSLPDADTCVHGDLHFGNIIKADGRNYLIDIASFSYGHPYFDIAMMVAIHNLQSIRPEYHKELFHCTVEQSSSSIPSSPDDVPSGL